jgi:hypothetical protein
MTPSVELTGAVGRSRYAEKTPVAAARPIVWNHALAHEG